MIARDPVGNSHLWLLEALLRLVTNCLKFAPHSSTPFYPPLHPLRFIPPFTSPTSRGLHFAYLRTFCHGDDFYAYMNTPTQVDIRLDPLSDDG
jgi:hypothetical protein